MSTKKQKQKKGAQKGPTRQKKTSQRQTIRDVLKELHGVKRVISQFQESVIGDLKRCYGFLNVFKQGILDLDTRMRAVETACGIEPPPTHQVEEEAIAAEIQEAVEIALDSEDTKIGFSEDDAPEEEEEDGPSDQ